MGEGKEVDFKPFPWERDIPLTCRKCTNSRYVTSVCYAAHQAREEADRLKIENARMHELVSLVQSTIGKLLEENYRERIVAVINRGYGAKRGGSSNRGH
jgi:hypothetical protein